MRQTVYKCDYCKQEIGDKVHISVSFGGYSGIAVPVRPNQWEVFEKQNGKFLHFCDEKHLASFFKELMVTAKTALKELPKQRLKNYTNLTTSYVWQR